TIEIRRLAGQNQRRDGGFPPTIGRHPLKEFGPARLTACCDGPDGLKQIRNSQCEGDRLTLQNPRSNLLHAGVERHPTAVGCRGRGREGGPREDEQSVRVFGPRRCVTGEFSWGRSLTAAGQGGSRCEQREREGGKPNKNRPPRKSRHLNQGGKNKSRRQERR